ncbi:MAG: hypothetical protein IJ722_07470 [Alloprevotella sp.]|nr:hypothetical protein [Alloprevotella sp.]
MRKSLLFLALAAIATGVSAQQFVAKERVQNRVAMTAKPKALSLEGAKPAGTQVMRLPARVTTTHPSTVAYRPDGFFWFTETYQTNWGQDGLAIGPSDVNVTFYGDFVGENSKWLYSVSEDELEELIWGEQAVSAADSSLTVTPSYGYWPAPMAIATSRVGGSALTAKTESDTTSFAAQGMLCGYSSGGVFQTEGGEYVDIPVGNFDPTYYLGNANIGNLFGMNMPTANANLANGFGGAAAGITGAETLAFLEFFPMNTEATALLKGIDMFIYSDERAPQPGDIGVAIQPISEDGQMGEPVAYFLIESVSDAHRYEDGDLMGYGVHFAPSTGTPLLVNGSFVAQIVPMEGSEYSWAPVTMVVDSPAQESFGYAYVRINVTNSETGATNSQELLQSVDVFNWGDPALFNPTIVAGINLSYDAEEIDQYTGISTPLTEKPAQQSGTFDLQGRRVNAATKGIYIVNGKKVMK